ncbi:MAG: methyltransferase [Sedimenticola sp.]
MPETEPLDTAFGSFDLKRFPIRRRETLRAWDAADEYLLNQLAEEGVAEGTRILILNDNFGALTVSLAKLSPQMRTDSYIASWSTGENLERNGIAGGSVDIGDTLVPYQGLYDLVLVRVTKTLALLEDELLRLKPHLHERSRVMGCGMVKQIHSSTLKLFETIIGPTRTSLARKKARLILSRPDMGIQLKPSPYPHCYPLENSSYTLCNHANLFSRERLDIGTRLLLQHIPRSDAYRDIVDLGCGNGVVGLLAAEANPGARLWFTDESFMAVASAEQNYRAAGLDNEAEFRVADCLVGFDSQSADLVLCNPPFHQQQVVGDFIAWRMFSQAYEVLRAGGELHVIGNRHLGYHVKMKRLFGNVQTLASNPKFVVLKSVKKGFDSSSGSKS